MALLVRLAVVTVLTGVGAGVGGVLLVLLLHLVQHLAYGYGLHDVIGRESFFSGVSAAAPLRRVAVMFVCGWIAGIGWFLLHRFARPLVTVDEALTAERPR